MIRGIKPRICLRRNFKQERIDICLCPRDEELGGGAY
jgi:hypothetical protein